MYAARLSEREVDKAETAEAFCDKNGVEKNGTDFAALRCPYRPARRVGKIPVDAARTEGQDTLS